jgi:hypothetical protein
MTRQALAILRLGMDSEVGRSIASFCAAIRCGIDNV